MPTRNVDLTDELEGFIRERVESGRYQNASDVVRTALRTLAREERESEAKLSALKAAIDEGDASGVMDCNPFERISAAIQISNKPA